ncbi:MAG TPA: winged helix-turn-helix transcriptional regulator [Methanocorpusculum sp.]|nr:winged helix-turn-helix transcriptional regulator [Methanocorpusculum sp.]
MLISLTDDKIPNDESQYVIEEQTDIKNSLDKTQYYLITAYGDLTGLPSAFISETISIFFILLGAGACTLLLTRWKLPEDPNSRPRILLNTIREHPGATQSELQKLTGHSRGSVSVNLHHLGMASKIRKSVQNGKTRYYLASTPDDEMKGFLRKLTTQENPQKILEAIINNPGISQKELHETTGIPKTTLQWHLSQLAKYEAIKSTRERNTVHYSVIPDLVLLYNNALEETKQNNTSAEEKEPDNKES